MDNSLDSKIHTNEPVSLAHIDINVMVTPGHDMVVNHVDGSQEVAQGHIAVAVMAQEATNGGVVVAPADVEAQSTETPRSSDPEVNGKDQPVATTPVATPVETPEVPETPVEETPVTDNPTESPVEDVPLTEETGQEEETPAE